MYVLLQNTYKLYNTLYYGKLPQYNIIILYNIIIVIYEENLKLLCYDVYKNIYWLNVVARKNVIDNNMSNVYAMITIYEYRNVYDSQFNVYYNMLC